MIQLNLKYLLLLNKNSIYLLEFHNEQIYTYKKLNSNNNNNLYKI